MLLSCKKESNETNTENSIYYVRYKLNGINKSYSKLVSRAKHDSLKISGTTKYWFEVNAVNADMKVEPINIAAWGIQKIKAGTFKDTETTDGVQVKAIITYLPTGSLSCISGGFLNHTMATGYTANTVIDITQLDGKTVKGTFSGTLYQLNLNGTPPLLSSSITITDGEFYLPVH
jgi:hypothetical protein